MTNSKGNTTLCRAVKLGNNERIQVKRLVEFFCLLKAILPGGGINNQDGIDRHVCALAHHGNNFF